jgi:hypothetical protein
MDDKKVRRIAIVGTGIDKDHLIDRLKEASGENVEIVQMPEDFGSNVMPIKIMRTGYDPLIKELEDFKYSHLPNKLKFVELQPVRTEPKYHRNQLCPCGSGKKYKNCCLK